MATVHGAVNLRLRAERRFYLGMALFVLAMVLIGFAPSYYLRGFVPLHFPVAPFTPLVHLHGAVFSLWIVLFLVQTGLISAGRPDIHRTLGRYSAGLAVLVFVLGVVTAAYAYHRPTAPPGFTPASWLAIPMLDMPVFVALVGLGIANRHRAQLHKRYMLIAMIGMLSPAIGRMPWPPVIPPPVAIFGIPDLALVALLIWDLKTIGRPHRATLIGAAILVGSQILRIAVMETPAWIGFAQWVGSLTA